MTRNRTRRLPACASAALLLALCSGCMQIDTRVQLHEDGSATITEKLRFSRRLLDLGATAEKGDIATLLSKESALKRMASMGEGIEMVSHEVNDVEGGARESVAVYKLPDLNNFQYVSPWLAYADYAENNVVECKLYPLYKSRAYQNGKAGEMVVNFSYVKSPKSEPRLEKDQPEPKGPTPEEVQVFRELGPVFKDMLRDFKLRLTFESYAPILRSGLGVRGQKAGAKEIDLINFTDKDLDAFGGGILDNEEVMLDLVRWELGSKDICSNVRGFASNLTLPVFVPHGSRHMWHTGGSDIPFKPSKTLFDKHFTGKDLNYNEWAEKPTDKKVPADFARIGWKGDQK